MKFKFINLIILSILLLSGCTVNTDNPDPDPDVPMPNENVEVYEPALMHVSSLVMAVENAGNFAYLLNREGEKLFTWEFTDRLGNDLELLDNGNVIGMFKVEDADITFGGYGGQIKIIAPDGSIVWSYEYSSEEYVAHHDVEILPNGNVLFMVWERITLDELLQNGGVPQDGITEFFTEKLIEVNPNTDQIVWEWRSWEHIIQDQDNSALNFGSIGDNPQRFDINYNSPIKSDFMHANGIDYDADRDVIFLSVNNFSEIWVIDHSTTTQEASTTLGGNYNKGGDLLYRFGNPLAYKNGLGEVRFDRNHFPNLLESGEVGEGNLLVYVNGITTEQSSVFELQIPETFSLIPFQDNEPAVVWSFTDTSMFSANISGAVRLSNGNTLICEGDYGYWEITPEGEIAWKYNGGGAFWRGYVYDFDFIGLPPLGITF